MPNALSNVDNGYLPSKYPIYPGNPPDLTREDPRHPRSILSQTEFANGIRNLPTTQPVIPNPVDSKPICDKIYTRKNVSLYCQVQTIHGDPAAFGMLVDKYKESVYALAYSKLQNFHDAEDITQEAFIKAYQKLRTLRRWNDFHVWIYAITSNLCKNWIRAESSRRIRSKVG